MYMNIDICDAYLIQNNHHRSSCLLRMHDACLWEIYNNLFIDHFLLESSSLYYYYFQFTSQRENLLLSSESIYLYPYISYLTHDWKKEEQWWCNSDMRRTAIDVEYSFILSLKMQSIINICVSFFTETQARELRWLINFHLYIIKIASEILYKNICIYL